MYSFVVIIFIYKVRLVHFCCDNVHTRSTISKGFWTGQPTKNNASLSRSKQTQSKSFTCHKVNLRHSHQYILWSLPHKLTPSICKAWLLNEIILLYNTSITFCICMCKLTQTNNLPWNLNWKFMHSNLKSTTIFQLVKVKLSLIRTSFLVWSFTIWVRTRTFAYNIINILLNFHFWEFYVTFTIYCFQVLKMFLEWAAFATYNEETQLIKKNF